MTAGADTVGCYAAERPWLDNPRNITVKSNFGGSASSAVSAK